MEVLWNRKPAFAGNAVCFSLAFQKPSQSMLTSSTYASLAPSENISQYTTMLFSQNISNFSSKVSVLVKKLNFPTFSPLLIPWITAWELISHNDQNLFLWKQWPCDFWHTHWTPHSDFKNMQRNFTIYTRIFGTKTFINLAISFET